MTSRKQLRCKNCGEYVSTGNEATSVVCSNCLVYGKGLHVAVDRWISLVRENITESLAPTPNADCKRIARMFLYACLTEGVGWFIAETAAFGMFEALKDTKLRCSSEFNVDIMGSGEVTDDVKEMVRLAVEHCGRKGEQDAERGIGRSTERGGTRQAVRREQKHRARDA